MELRKFIERSLIDLVKCGACGPIEFDLAVTPQRIRGEDFIWVTDKSENRIKLTVEVE